MLSFLSSILLWPLLSFHLRMHKSDASVCRRKPKRDEAEGTFCPRVPAFLSTSDGTTIEELQLE